ncbi:MAG: hypothetical protein GY948_26130, partial [Alphaproteobacteria bacterium]|nr:hypothetical protein [Alphaproteobacteria bacterium]
SLGGGLIADIGYHEYEDQTIALSILMGELDASRVTANIGVQAVEYGVVPVVDSTLPVTATLPLAWTNAALSLPNESLTYWNASYTPTTEGYYRIYSRATDVSGNTEDDEVDWYDGAFIVDDTNPTVTWLSPANGSNFGTGFVTLQAQTADYIGNEFNIGSIAFEINGTSYPATWSSADWEADGSTPRTFILYTDVISTGLPIGSYSAKAVVVDEAGNSAETSLITFNVTGVGTADTIAPTLTITSHVSGDIVDEYETIIAGTGSDAESGIQSYAVSLDGGITWQDAIDTGSGFAYTWLIGAAQGTTYPVPARAIAWAANIPVEPLP